MAKNTETIRIDRNAAADAIAMTRLLRTNQPDMALFILQSYGTDVARLHSLCGAMAAFTAAVLDKVDSLSDELNRSADVLVPNGEAVLAAAAQRVACFDPSDSK